MARVDVVEQGPTLSGVKHVISPKHRCDSFSRATGSRTVREIEIVGSLAEIRETLCRKHQLSGNPDDRIAIEEAIAAVSIAEERVKRLLTPLPG